MKINKISLTFDVVDTQTDEPEDRNFTTEMDDIKLRRTNPNRYDKRKDWYNYINENLRDSDTSNRYYITTLNKGANQITDFNDDSDDVPPGFVPTSEGMRTPEDIIDDLIYMNYKYNRDKVTPEMWKKMLNRGLDPKKDRELIERNNKKVDLMEKRYQIEKRKE